MATSLGKVGIVDKGNYSSEATYNSGDFIFYEGSTWLALRDGLLGVNPTEGENWKYLARGVPDGIATAEQVGVVKPSEDLIIAEDGTLGINTVFETIAERANIESGDTWKTVLGKINKYFGDIKPHAFLDKITEDYIDNVITQKVNNAIQKAAIVNNAVTTIEGTVLDGRMGKTLQDQITEQNNNIGAKKYPIGSIKEFALNCSKGLTTFSTNVAATDLPNQSTEWLYTSGYVLRRDDEGTTTIILHSRLTNKIAQLSFAPPNTWSDWDLYVKNSDLYPVTRVNGGYLADMLRDKTNKVTLIAFVNPSDCPFSFKTGYCIAFNSLLITNDKTFTLIGTNGTSIETKVLTIT